MLTPWSLAQGALKKRLYMLWRMRADLNHAQAIHYTSRIEAEGGRALGLKPKSLLVPLGVDLNEFQPLPPRGSFRARYPQLKDHPVVMYLGRLYNHKGLELLIPALARMSVRDAMLAIVGPDQDGFEAKLRGLVSEHGLNDRVVFTGLVRGRERIEALVDADVFALPSFHENFGVAAIEALAAGCPVIVSDQVGVADQIADDSVASIVPTQVEPLATELDRWLKNPDLREQAKRRAPALVRERFDWDEIAARWMGHYLVILDDYRKSVR
jgi:glycosyltransferase involved in cell wall biosynthesis